MVSMPALDAVGSKRIGILRGPDYNIAALLHDTDQPVPNKGELFRQSRPVCLETTAPICVETVICNASTTEKQPFSPKFWEEAAKIYRAVSPEHELEDDECIEFGEIPGEFETVFLSDIYQILSDGQDLNHEVWQEVLQEAEWDKRENSPTGDVDLFNERPFTESIFTDQQYLPADQYIDRWGLYEYSYDSLEFQTRSLWVRYEDCDGHISELPLVYQTNGVSVIVSSDPDFGGVNSHYASDALLTALDDRDPTQTSGSEADIVAMIADTELGSRTQDFLGALDEAEPVPPETTSVTGDGH